MQTVDYEIAPHRPRAHRFRVTCSLAAPDPAGQVFSLPAWIPGSYLIREFARNILSVRASTADGTVAVTKSDKLTWRCAPCTGPLTVTAQIYARDASVRAAFLDDRRGFFNGTSVFLRPAGAEEAPVRLRIVAPDSVSVPWQVATTLTPERFDARGFGDYRAANYAALIDHPVAMAAELDRVAFEVRGVPHACVLVGRHDGDRERLAADLARVCATHAALFDELPTTGYLFLTQLAPAGFGGIEHCDCSALVVARDALPLPGVSRRSDAYMDMLGLCSHEYFHLWNVKRIRPAAVAASDLLQEAYFADLWAYEGVTSYYDDLALVRAGLLDPQAYLQRLARSATRLAHNAGRHVQSLAESSFDAWTKFYRPDENTSNAVASYYNKGALVALTLDLHLRLYSDGAVSLDDVMRALWQRYGRTGGPVPEHGLEALAAEVSGLDLQPFFAACVHATADPPLDDLLPAFGVRCERVAPDAGDGAAFLLAQGLRLTGGRDNGGGARVATVATDSPTQNAGLCPEDTIVAVDGLRADADNLAARLRRLAPGASASLHLFRADELLSTDLIVAPAAADGWRLTLADDADAAMSARREAWLGLSS